MSDLEICKSFAEKHNLILELEGECGFGRECVGFIGKNDNWVDHNPMNMVTHEPIAELVCEAVEPPEDVDAYHKHDCLAVLGRGDDAVGDLAKWVTKMESAGTVSIVEYSTGATGVQAVFTGSIGYTVVVNG